MDFEFEFRVSSCTPLVALIRSTIYVAYERQELGPAKGD